MTSLRKVHIVNTADEGGGAERLSMATLEAFNRAGIDTWLLVGNKRTRHPKVMPLFQSPFIDYRPYARRHRQAALKFRRWIDRTAGLEDFQHPYSHRILDITGSPPDLVVCGNLHGGYFDLRALRRLSLRVPVVVRVVDDWLFTGHCAMPLACKRWENGCGRCPDLTIPPAISRDATRINWIRKRRILRGTRLYVTAQTDWMIDRIRRSPLAQAAVEIKHVPGGISRDDFRPASRSGARRRLGIATDAKVLMTVANGGAANPYKDFATIRAAVEQLPGLLDLFVVGSDRPREEWWGRARVHHVEYLHQPARLAEYYRAADLYVHAAFEEPFGGAVAEALACGLPVVTASSSGVAEVVRHGETGLVVEPANPRALAEAITGLLEQPARREQLGQAAAADAGRLDIAETVRKLHEWCDDIIRRERCG